MSMMEVMLAATLAAVAPDKAHFDAGLEAARAAAYARHGDIVKPVRTVWTKGEAQRIGETVRLKYEEGGEKPVMVLDFGEASYSGWAFVDVRSQRGEPMLRLAYSCFPEETCLTEEGNFSEASRAVYMGRDMQLPVLPANINRYELYPIGRLGRYISPMLMAQFRYVRLQLDTPGEVEIGGISVYVGGAYDRTPPDGYVATSDEGVNLLWRMSVWTAQISTILHLQAWKSVSGWLLPRKLERGSDVNLAKSEKLPEEGALTAKFETMPNPDQLSTLGFAIFAESNEKAVLVSVAANGTVKYVRRRGGADETLAEHATAARFGDYEPHELTVSWRKGVDVRGDTTRTYRTPYSEIAVALDGVQIDSYRLYRLREGDGFGFWCEKGWWPAFDEVKLTDCAGKELFADDFLDEALANWNFERPKAIVADGALRDRLIWSGDLLWAGPDFYYSFRSAPFMRNSVELLARSQTPDGFTHACPYPEQPAPLAGDYGPFPSDEFAAWLLPVAHDYWLHTGDETVISEFWPRFRKLICYLKAHTGENGLFEPRLETSAHAFAPGLKPGDERHRAYMDILLWRCWRDSAEMARCAGEKDLAEELTRLAEKCAVAIRANYWDAKRGRFIESLEPYGVKRAKDGLSVVKGDALDPERLSPQVNALALGVGFATQQEAEAIAGQLGEDAVVRKFCVLGGAGKFAYGLPDAGWDSIITNKWALFLEKDYNGPRCTTEGMSVERHYGFLDKSHPDTTLGLIVPPYLLGIRPVEPGFARFVFAPMPFAGLKWAEGRVPTKFGDIDARWEREGGTLRMVCTVPEGTRADFIAPTKGEVKIDGATGSGRNLGPGRHILTIDER